MSFAHDFESLEKDREDIKNFCTIADNVVLLRVGGPDDSFPPYEFGLNEVDSAEKLLVKICFLMEKNWVTKERVSILIHRVSHYLGWDIRL